jgi:uncharacterized integral membrane protein
MKTLVNLVASVVVAVWIGAIAILAIQNFAPVSLRFLAFQSIQIPVGLVVAFGVGLGLIGGAIVQPLLLPSGSPEELEE